MRRQMYNTFSTQLLIINFLFTINKIKTNNLRYTQEKLQSWNQDLETKELIKSLGLQ